MNETQDRVVRMEQDAGRLVDELVALKREVGSYKAATTELEKIRTSLETFIVATQGLTSETYKLIQITNTIGGSKILEEIASLRSALEISAKKEATGKLLIIGFLCISLILQILILVAFSK